MKALQNEIEIGLNSNAISGIKYYEGDSNNDGITDFITNNTFIPDNGFSTSSLRFRAVSNSSLKSEWSSNYYAYKDSSVPINPISEGLYYILSMQDNNYALDNSGVLANNSNVYMWSHSDNPNQKWYIKYLNDGYYQIIVNDNKSLGLDIDQTSNNNWINQTNIQLYTIDTSETKNSQKFKILKAVDGGYIIATTNGTHVIDVTLDNDATVSNGTNVYVYSFNNGANQRWEFVKACTYKSGTTWEFNYTGGEQKFVAQCDGTYKLETWGAQGGEIEYTRYGYGGYSKGYSYLERDSILYINVGESGKTLAAESLTAGCIAKERELPNTYNGGGGAKSNVNDQQIASGGGATHIATKSGELKTLEKYKDTAGTNLSNEILIVSGGGGGTSCWNVNENKWWCKFDGGYHSGGGFETNTDTANTSGDYEWTWHKSLGSTQTSGYAFGQGGFGAYAASGGGGGWYGGNTNTVVGTGGTGYIASPNLTSYNGDLKVMYCYDCPDSDNESTKTISTDNASETPISSYAKIGNGYAKITYVAN